MIQIETELFLFSNPGNPITVRKISKIEQAFKPNKNCQSSLVFTDLPPKHEDLKNFALAPNSI